MKKILLLLSLLIFTLGFSQVKKPVKKKYTPKKQKIVKKEASPVTDSISKDKGRAPIGKVTDSIIVGNLSQKKDTVIAKSGILGKSEVIKTDSQIAEQILKTNGYISTRNFDTKGKVTAIFKGAYVNTATNKVFFLLEIDNRSFIEYSINTISFTLSSSGGDDIETGKRLFRPIGAFPNQSVFKGKTKTKLVIAFDKFSISENNILVLNISEEKGDRDLNINIKGGWIIGAKSVR